MKVVSLYARVSSEKQAQERTIESQVAELERRISEDEHELLDEYKFIDNGYSGANLERPGLDRLRDKVKEGKIDKIYIHSPDRLSRKAVYQIILLDEFEKAEVEVIFLNFKTDKSPESNLLLQIQGAIAEYERAKIIERNRRGILYAARRGSVSVMKRAPYGYNYIKRRIAGEKSKFEVDEEEAKVVKKLFKWIGEERVSLREVVCRLKERSIKTQKGKGKWHPSIIATILRNPAYKGQAAYGKTKVSPVKTKIRPQKNAAIQPRYSVRIDRESWIYIPVPKIVDEALFNTVQEQLDENRKRARIQRRKETYLLQGLVVCQRCGYAYCGTYYGGEKRGGVFSYYRCSTVGVGSYSNREKCDNKSVRTEALEMAIWKRVKNILNRPERLINECQQRLSKNKGIDEDLEKQESRLKRNISGLIDSYIQEYINQEKFELRIKIMRQHLKEIEEKKEEMKSKKKAEQDLTVIISSLKKFASGITSEIDQYDWLEKREVIRKLVERIEIGLSNITIVFRIKEFVTEDKQNQVMQPIIIKKKFSRLKSKCG